jgi:predicted TPR repeat methyltransferase
MATRAASIESDVCTEGGASRPRAGCRVEFPTRWGGEVGQDQEWCWVHSDSGRTRVRFHDYHELYRIPGLYEHVFYERLECNSPRTVCGLLAQEVDRAASVEISDLRILDVGAGNGMVGEILDRMGAGELVGVDIIAEAAEAAERDRPGVYDSYVVADLTNLPNRARAELEARDFNCLTTVAALGFGDIPPLAFAEAYNLITAPGWLAFNIKEDFLTDKDSTGFSMLIRRMVQQRLVEIRSQKRYHHRLSITGSELHYVAVVAVKNRDLPRAWLQQLAET